jgi:hypothetical protein
MAYSFPIATGKIPIFLGFKLETCPFLNSFEGFKPLWLDIFGRFES